MKHILYPLCDTESEGIMSSFEGETEIDMHASAPVLVGLNGVQNNVPPNE